MFRGFESHGLRHRLLEIRGYKVKNESAIDLEIPIAGNEKKLSDQLPNFATRRVVRPPTDLKKIPPRHGNHKPPSAQRKYWRWAFKGLAVGLGAIIAIAGISALDLFGRLNQDNIVLEGSGPVDLNGPINILVVGSDTRKDQGEGFGDVTSELADVIMLLHISEDRTNASVLSFPRDLLVSIPACSNPDGEDFEPVARRQINSSISYGGVACTHKTVEELTGIDIPFLAMIDFKGVIEMSNAIGGVEVVIDKPIYDDYSAFYIDAGTHTLQGAEALAFLRTRHGVGDGSDLARISNQQKFLMSLFTKIKDEGVLNNPIRLYSLSSAAARNMRLSESMTDLGTMVTLAGALRDVEPSKLTFLQVPSVALGGTDFGRLDIIADEANKIFDQIKQDKPVISEESATQ